MNPPKSFKTNYVLIDFENLQPDSLKQLDRDYFKVLVFVGACQERFPVDMTTILHGFGARVEYIKISGKGNNALDFHIAYYIGQRAASDPAAYFHIISKDSGFDPLIEHLRANQIFVHRAERIVDIPLVKISTCKTLAERIELIVGKLKQPKATKPGTLKKLESMIARLFLRQISDKEVSGLIEELARKRHLTVSGTKITYALSK